MSRARAIRDAFWRVERSGARLGLQVRLAAITVIGIGLLFRASGDSLLYYYGVLALLLTSGALYYGTVAWPPIARSAWSLVPRALLVALDMGLATYALITPAPGFPPDWPEAMQFRVATVGYLFVFAAFSALTYAPSLALWSGVSAAAAWFLGALWVETRPGAFTRAPADFARMETDEIVATLTDPNYVSLIAAAQESLLLLIAGVVLSAAVWRGRVLALKEVEEAEKSAALARYFSPDVAKELTRRPLDLGSSETREAAVLFADVVGFTTMAEQMSPEDTIRFLREFHRAASESVFAHGGTLNKFIGDEVMASFGAIRRRPSAAADALACAVEIARRVALWSAEREAAGLAPVRVGVGLHVGPVVVGDIGDARCLELAVLGDVVNVASRLQTATRAHPATVVASRAALDAALEARTDLAALAAAFEPLPALALRGRRGAVDCAGAPFARLRMDAAEAEAAAASSPQRAAREA